MEREEQFIDNKALRDKAVNHYEVLEKVKQLLLVLETDFATTQQVADYYEVDKEAINKVIQRNEDELTSDGLCKLSRNETIKKLGKDIMSTPNFRGGFQIDNIKFNNRSNILFTRRAILRVGMLLRDSEIAKEVRTQLLNIEEKASDETKIADINEEQKLAMALGMAQISGNLEAITMATGKLMAFKNRHIAKLENDNKALAGEILDWGNRKMLNAGIRQLAAITRVSFGDMWNMLYKELQYKHGINLKGRSHGDTPYIQFVKENEWSKVLKTFSAICKAYNQSPTDMFQKTVPSID